MRGYDPFEPKKYKLTCHDLSYNGVECCEECHDPEFAEYSLRVVKIDGVDALVCCAVAAFFYPKDPSRGVSPEERLLAAIFGNSMTHEAAVKYIKLEEDD